MLLQNNDDAQQALEQVVSSNKSKLLQSNLMINNKQITNSDTIKYLLALAEHSFEREKVIYKKGGDTFANEMEQAFEAAKNGTNGIPKAELYFKATGLGTKLTSLFYTGSPEPMDKGLHDLLKILASLDVQKMASDVQVQVEDTVNMGVASVLNDFFIQAKNEKNTARMIDNGTGIANIFSVIYNEKNIMKVIRGEKLTASDIKNISKIELDKIKNSSEFRAITERAKRAELLKNTELNAVDMTNEIITGMVEDLINRMFQEVAAYAKQENGVILNEREIKDTILNMLRSGKMETRETFESRKNSPFLFSGAGADRQGFTMAAYRINIDAMSGMFTEFLIEQNNNKINSISIDSIDTTIYKELDDITTKALNQYNMALCRYCGGTSSAAWIYYEEHFLNSVIYLANRDLQSAKGAEIKSNIHNELTRTINKFKDIRRFNDLINDLKVLKNNNLLTATTLKDAISKCKKEFNMADKKDKESLAMIEKLAAGGQIQDAYDLLLKRMTSKRAGHSNVNGYIGEIFISSVLQAVYEKEKPILEQRGASVNLHGEDAHIDIRLDDIGIQAKMYGNNNNALYQTTVDFSLDTALRYLRTNRSSGDTDRPTSDDELSAFRFFLLNSTALQSPLTDQYFGEWRNNKLFLQALNLRISNFFRYTEGLSTQDLQNLCNNFYLINTNVVPASLIFIRMAELLSETDDKDNFYFDFQNNSNIASFNGEEADDYRLTKNSNLLKHIKAYATFKSFSMNLADLGVEEFLSREQLNMKR